MGPQGAGFWVGKRFKNCSGVYSCRWTTFIFYVSFNSDIWFWLNFVIFLTFCLGSTYVVQQLSFSMFPLILTFEFDLIFRSFWLFGALMGYFFEDLDGVKKLSYIVEQISFSMFPSILIFDFYLILGSFFSFWGPNGLFLRLGKGLNTVLGSTHMVEQLSFSMLPKFLTFDFDLILGSFLPFWALMGYFWSRRRVQKLFWGLLM